ncbi:hypothetical protein ACO0LO_09040 [Undibacterium sp. TJN25]
MFIRLVKVGRVLAFSFFPDTLAECLHIKGDIERKWRKYHVSRLQFEGTL